jgi:hypothetical protein
MRWRRIILMVSSLAGVAVVAHCAGGVWRLIEAGGPAGIHQTAVKNEMAAWEREYRTLRDWREAWRAAGMLDYIRTYYFPGPGYRGSARTEAELETQRARTLEAIAAGLREFTGQDFGTDTARWQEWLIRQGHADGR